MFQFEDALKANGTKLNLKPLITSVRTQLSNYFGISIQ